MNIDKAKIHAFAVKWITEFRLQHIHEAEHLMGDECAALGFVMDRGESFAAKYPDASMDTGNIGLYINEIDDLQLLGNAIYSRWRYYQHWACSPWDVPWFITALNRLAELTSE